MTTVKGIAGLGDALSTMTQGSFLRNGPQGLRVKLH